MMTWQNRRVDVTKMSRNCAKTGVAKLMGKLTLWGHEGFKKRFSSFCRTNSSVGWPKKYLNSMAWTSISWISAPIRHSIWQLSMATYLQQQPYCISEHRLHSRYYYHLQMSVVVFFFGRLSSWPSAKPVFVIFN